MPILDAYRGFATTDGLFVRGRVLTRLRRTQPEPESSRWTNLRQMVGLFLTDEVADVPVVEPNSGARTLSDREGYFLLDLPSAGALPGWSEVDLEIAGLPSTRRPFPVLIPHPRARHGVISDVDDTLMRTGAYSLPRNLWTTFTGSALTREVYPDAVALLRRLHDACNPIFYVSSSPWNLHHFLERVFRRAGLEPGPMMLRDFGLRGTGGHREHKGDAIDRILGSLPRLPFWLIGDTGQKDALVYREAIRRHPGRIVGVVLREPAVGASAESRAAIDEIETAGVHCHHAPDFAALVEGPRLRQT